MDLKEEIAREVREETGIEVTARDVAEVISGLLVTPDFWEAVWLARLPFNVVAGTINSLARRGWVKVTGEGKISFTPAGKDMVDRKGVRPRRIYTCPSCEGRGVALKGLEDLLRKFKEVSAQRPQPVIEYDQGFVTPETTVSRVALMAGRGDLEGKKLLVLGDDDLVSLATGLSGMPREVVVLEIDERLLAFINEVAREEHLPVTARRYDFRDKLPDEYVGHFDTFITDPPETLEALEVCLNRGLSGLKGGGCAGYFGLTHTESSYKKWNLLQQLLVGKFKVTITDIIEDFNHYVNWDYLLPSLKTNFPFVKVQPRLNWYRSTMYRIQTLGQVEGIKNEPANCELYVDEEALPYDNE
ncbi:MAG: N4-bis(aminopropyl)spermidine synthase [Bacillota bacterium]|nr:N4-bis(aminopropyl)spermidine synthase [Bacillota bacterium]